MKLRHTLPFLALALALLAGCASDTSKKPTPVLTLQPTVIPAQVTQLYDEFKEAFLNGDYEKAKSLLADDGPLAAKLFESQWQMAHPPGGARNVTIVFEQLSPDAEAYVGAFKIAAEQTQPGNPGVKNIRIRQQGVAIVKDAHGEWTLHL